MKYPAPFIFFLIALFPIILFAQNPGSPGPFARGVTDVTFTNSSLNSSSVTARVYYPGTQDGTDVPMASVTAPVVAFGHGFNLSYTDYENLCSHLATHGFVVISPDVQNGFNVDHLEYAKELGACLDYILDEGANSNSIFFGQIDSLTGVYGHSMGGGASGLVPGVYPGIDAVSGLAAAETNPSAIAALGNYSGPLQMISGSDDNVADEAGNQIPMFNAGTGVKQWVSLTGGGHCKFTDGTTVCDFVSAPGSLSRSDQQALTNEYTTAFFAYHLQGNDDMLPWLCGNELEADSTAGTLTFATTHNCNMTGMETGLNKPELNFFPNPAENRVFVQGTEKVEVFNLSGQILQIPVQKSEQGVMLDISSLPNGTYWIRDLKSGQGKLLLVR